MQAARIRCGLISSASVFFHSIACFQTVSVIHAFFQAMTLYPEVQKRAQAEIEAVLGPNTLPTFSDRARLPYVDALVKEAQRWHTVVPLSESASICAVRLSTHGIQ